MCEQVCLSCSRAGAGTGSLSGFLSIKSPKQQDEQSLSKWEEKVPEAYGSLQSGIFTVLLCDKRFRCAPGKADLFVLAVIKQFPGMSLNQSNRRLMLQSSCKAKACRLCHYWIPL